MQAEGERFEMEILDVRVGSVEAEGYRTVTLATSRGDVECRHYPAPNATRAALWVPGAIGGWHTPAGDLYPRLSREFLAEDVTSLQVLYRQAAMLGECILDLLAGLAYLEGEGVEAVSFTGHSFGGAVVIQAGAASPLTRTVVTLATQGYGADAVTRLPDDASILLVHGTADQILPPASSERVYARAHEPKRLMLYPGANHNLDQVAAEVHDLVHDWILQALTDPAGTATPTG
ncbi:MAG: alpha/beta hydrolase [Chloroflexota bacterium]|nr:alpha/beta hydrolase [Chloroflexota bacterium]